VHGDWDPESINQNIWIVNVETGEEIQITDAIPTGDPNYPEDYFLTCDPANDPFEDLGPAWRHFRLVSDAPPALSFARTENFGGNPLYYNGAPDPYNLRPLLGSPSCANTNRVIGGGDFFSIENFDVVVWDGLGNFNNTNLTNFTANADVDQLGPAWSHEDEKLIFWVREGDAAYGPDHGNVWIQFLKGTQSGPILTQVQLTDLSGWVMGPSDWADDDSEVLLSMGEDFQAMGLWTMDPPDSSEDSFEEPTLLIPNGFAGKYRPGHH
jgi:hypothetical protein